MGDSVFLILRPSRTEPSLLDLSMFPVFLLLMKFLMPIPLYMIIMIDPLQLSAIGSFSFLARAEEHDLGLWSWPLAGNKMRTRSRTFTTTIKWGSMVAASIMLQPSHIPAAQGLKETCIWILTFKNFD